MLSRSASRAKIEWPPFPNPYVQPLVFEDAAALSPLTFESLADWELRRTQLVCPPAWNLGGDANWQARIVDRKS
jgi:hypothetical protein